METKRPVLLRQYTLTVQLVGSEAQHRRLGAVLRMFAKDIMPGVPQLDLSTDDPVRGHKTHIRKE